MHPVYWLLLLGIASAAAGVRATIIIPSILAGLLAFSLPKYAELWPRARDAGASTKWLATVAASVGGSIATTLGAYYTGLLIRVLFWPA